MQISLVTQVFNLEGNDITPENTVCTYLKWQYVQWIGQIKTTCILFDAEARVLTDAGTVFLDVS